MFYIFSPKHYQHRMYTYICNNIITSWKKFEIKRLSIIDFSFEINEAFFYFLTRCRCRTKLLFLAESSSVFVQSTDWGFLNQTDRKKTRRYSQNFNSSNALWRWFFFFFFCWTIFDKCQEHRRMFPIIFKRGGWANRFWQ